MRIAVISDIHGNMEALSSVFKDIKVSAIDEIISLGDNIGYGPEPEDVIKTVTKQGVFSICGNHEIAVNNIKFADGFNPSAKKALHYTIKELSDESFSIIQKYPLYRIRHNCYFVHGFPPKSVFEYLFMVSDQVIIDALMTLNSYICFVGHTHTLELVILENSMLSRNPLAEGEVKLDDSCKYLVNAGSVGQPRDKNKDAKYLIYDTEKNSLETRFVKYDKGPTIQKMKDAELPWQIAMNLI